MKILKIHKLKKLTKWHPIKQMSTKRNWIKIDNKINISDIRIMSYNLLASQYMSADFPRWLNEKQNLKIRTEKIKKELFDINADIVCVQELEQNNLDNFYSDLNEKYNIHFLKKTGKRKDGCATLWKKSRIDCIWTGELPLKVSNVFQEYNHSCYINEDNVALFSLLKDRDNNKYFLICNTHLLYNSSKNDIKFCQIMIIYKAFSTILQNFEHLKPSVFFIGDLNLIPFSNFYILITTGQMNLENNIIKNLSGQLVANKMNSIKADKAFHFLNLTKKYTNFKGFTNRNSEFILNKMIEILTKLDVVYEEGKLVYKYDFDKKNTNSFEYNLETKNLKLNFGQLNSSYADIYKKCAESPKNTKNSLVNKYLNMIKNDQKISMTYEFGFSQVALDFKTMVDYILYKSEDWTPTGIYQVVDYENIMDYPFFPNDDFPSDHFSLVTDFKLKI